MARWFAHRSPLPFAWALAAWLTTALSTGCVSAAGPEIKIHESPNGAVYLEPLPDKSLHAAHPITLPAQTIAHVLRGVQVVGDKSAVESLFDSKLKPSRVFTEEEVGFLAPHVVKALAQATASQQVRFRLTHMVSPIAFPEREGAAVGSSEPPSYGLEPETTSGSLYVHGLSMHLTLEEYRHQPVRPDAVNMPNRRLPDRTGLDHLQVVFTPEAAARPDSFKSSSFFGDSNTTTVVIDYQLLATLPAAPIAPPPAPVSQRAPAKNAGAAKGAASAAPGKGGAQPPAAQADSPASAELQSVKDLLIKKDLEMQELKEELRAIKKHLAEQDAEKSKPKKKKKPAAAPPPAPQPLP